MCGTPVISTNFGGLVETVSHKFSGYRVWDAEDAARALGKLDKLAPAEAIRARAINWWSMRNVRHEYQEYFEKLSLVPN
jgi:glycosyltransferase involved in cell wall biosynthesis